MDNFVRRLIKLALISSIAISIILALMGKFIFLGGFLTGTAWSMINFILVINILKAVLLQKDKKQISVMLLIKFPVLYLSALLILVWNIFPVFSMLLGITLVFVIIGALRLWPRLA